MKICSHCGHQNEEEARYCLACGESLQDNEIVAAADAREEVESLLSPSVPAIENDTPFNQETLKSFYKNVLICGIICLICGLFIILVALIETWRNQFPVWFLFSGIVFSVLGGFYIYLFNKTTKQNKTVTETSRQLYIFKDNGIQAIFSDNGEKLGESFIHYEKISKVTKRNHFLLFWFGNTVYLVDCNTFTKGSKEEAIALLKEKCPPKTIKVK